MIKVQNISKSFSELEIINDFSYEFIEGNIYVIVGESGVGKSTLLKIVGGLTKADSGEIFYEGYKLSKPFKNKRLYQSEISHVFQDCLLVSDLTIEQNLKLLGYTNISPELFNLVNLHKPMDQLVGKLSGGEKQKLALLRALIKNPKYLFLDEITANLDQKNGEIIVDVIKNLKSENRVIIVVTHDLRFVDIANHVVELKNG